MQQAEARRGGPLRRGSGEATRKEGSGPTEQPAQRPYTELRGAALFHASAAAEHRAERAGAPGESAPPSRGPHRAGSRLTPAQDSPRSPALQAGPTS